MTGRRFSLSVDLSRRKTSWPSIPGIFRSSRIGYIHENKKTGKQLGCVELSYQETEYKTGVARLWLCFSDFYSGYAVDKAAKMWEKISNAKFPADVNEFICADMLYPSRMLLDLNGQYPEIKDIEALPF